jgi:phage regulator Rha-like protein
MLDKVSIVHREEIENRIFTIRGVLVMLDSHLSEIYNVENKRLNEQVKRNINRFPGSFMFQLTDIEWDSLRSQIATLRSVENIRSQFATLDENRGKHRKYLPYVFTEQGVAMLSAVLRSETAVKVSIQIMDAFVQMRKLALNNAGLFQRLDKIEVKQTEADRKFEQIFKALESRNQQPEKGIFFEGQVFDAWVFVAGLIKTAKSDIILVDSYVDETILTLLAKRPENVTATIYTGQISKQLQLDLAKHNVQYPAIAIKTLATCHDRFLLLDRRELYHIGASLKDLGKKWFAFSRMDTLTGEVLKKLSNE